MCDNLRYATQANVHINKRKHIRKHGKVIGHDHTIENSLTHFLTCFSIGVCLIDRILRAPTQGIFHSICDYCAKYAKLVLYILF